MPLKRIDFYNNILKGQNIILYDWFTIFYTIKIKLLHFTLLNATLSS